MFTVLELLSQSIHTFDRYGQPDARFYIFNRREYIVLRMKQLKNKYLKNVEYNDIVSVDTIDAALGLGLLD